LDDKNEDNVALQTLFAEVTADWQDTNGRRFSVVDWAVQISVRVDERHYTAIAEDIGQQLVTHWPEDVAEANRECC